MLYDGLMSPAHVMAFWAGVDLALSHWAEANLAAVPLNPLGDELG
jgi:hypothetical protein